MTTSYEHLASYPCTAAGVRRACRRLPAAGSSINPVMVIFLRHATGQS